MLGILLADAVQGGWQSEDEKEIAPDRAALLWIVGRGLFSNGSAVGLRIGRGLNMNAADVMVSNVIAVSPDATVQEVAEILLKNKISAVPVVSQSGKILGIVSEGDLLRRVESHTLRHRSWWLQLLMANTTLRDEFVKSHSHKVVDVMTPKVLTVSPETPLGEIASVLEKKRHQARACREGR